MIICIYIHPISLLTLHPTNIAWLNLSRNFPMDMRIPPLKHTITYAWVKPSEIHNVSREIGRTLTSPIYHKSTFSVERTRKCRQKMHEITWTYFNHWGIAICLIMVMCSVSMYFQAAQLCGGSLLDLFCEHTLIIMFVIIVSTPDEALCSIVSAITIKLIIMLLPFMCECVLFIAGGSTLWRHPPRPLLHNIYIYIYISYNHVV